jgi:hypothetical protein
MSDLAVSIEGVRELGRRLRFVAAQFEGADDIASDYAEAASHDDLAHELNQFADNWEVCRSDLMENLGKLAEHARTAGHAYHQVEVELQRALGGEG